MALHGGLLRLGTPGNGAIVDLTEGLRSIVRRSEVDQVVPRDLDDRPRDLDDRPRDRVVSVPVLS